MARHKRQGWLVSDEGMQNTARRKMVYQRDWMLSRLRKISPTELPPLHEHQVAPTSGDTTGLSDRCTRVPSNPCISIHVVDEMNGSQVHHT